MFLISAAIILAVDDTNALLLNETSGVCVITSLDSKSLDTIFLVLKKGTVGLCVLMDRACLGSSPSKKKMILHHVTTVMYVLAISPFKKNSGVSSFKKGKSLYQPPTIECGLHNPQPMKRSISPPKIFKTGQITPYSSFEKS